MYAEKFVNRKLYSRRNWEKSKNPASRVNNRKTRLSFFAPSFPEGCAIEGFVYVYLGHFSVCLCVYSVFTHGEKFVAIFILKNSRYFTLTLWLSFVCEPRKKSGENIIFDTVNKTAHKKKKYHKLFFLPRSHLCARHQWNGSNEPEQTRNGKIFPEKKLLFRSK